MIKNLGQMTFTMNYEIGNEKAYVLGGLYKIFVILIYLHKPYTPSLTK